MKPAIAAAMVALLVAAPVAAEKIARPVTTEIDGVIIDWSRGVVTAHAVGPADRHAPSPAVARVAALRLAESIARRRLTEVVSGLPWARGGTVGEVATGDAGRRLAREIGLAPVDTFDLGTDGSATVDVVIGVEAIRQAIDGPRPWTGDEPATPVVVIDARGLAVTPTVGLDVAATQSWRGPVRFIRDKPSHGATVMKAQSIAKGVITIDNSVPVGAIVLVLVAKTL